MPDLDKVIREIKMCTSGGYPCENCSHYGHGEDLVGCMDELLSDALALLKEQEAVEPILEKLKFSETWVCGNCQNELFVGDVIRDNYCSNCGRKVQWDA